MQANQLKSGIKYGPEVTLKLSSNVFGNSNDDNNFPQKLLLINHKFWGLEQLLETGFCLMKNVLEP